MKRPDRDESRRESSFPLKSGTPPGYDGGLRCDKWEIGLNPLRIAATLPSLGETEASSAGEQLAEGEPGRAVAGLRLGRPSGLPATYPASGVDPGRIHPPLLSAYASRNSHRRRNGWPVGPAPPQSPESPEECGRIFRSAHG